jgi:hypothetical protein
LKEEEEEEEEEDIESIDQNLTDYIQSWVHYDDMNRASGY